MKHNNYPHRNEDLAFLLVFLWKWKKVILGAGIFAALAAALITSPFITKPQYEATSILFATRSSSPEKLMDEQEFGYDIDADRLLQIFESNDLRDSVAGHFNLAAHYEIDKNEKQWKHNFRKTYDGNITFSRTKYMSIVISVLDTDPVLAADIANTIPAIADKLKERILKKNAKAALEITENEYIQKLELVEKLRTQIDALREKNSSTLTGVLSTHYKDKNENVKKLRLTLDEFRKNYNIYDYGSQVNILNSQLAQAKSAYNLEKGKLSIYEKKLLPADTLYINTQARMEGAKQQLETVQTALAQLSSINKEYIGLIEKLNTEQSILNQVQPEYEKMQYSFEPNVSSSLLNKLHFTYTAEMNMLNDLMVRYEKARHNYNMPVAKAYVVSQAEPTFKKKFPRKTLSVLLAFLLTSFMTVISILVVEKIAELKQGFSNENVRGKNRDRDKSPLHKVH